MMVVSYLYMIGMSSGSKGLKYSWLQMLKLWRRPCIWLNVWLTPSFQINPVYQSLKAETRETVLGWCLLQFPGCSDLDFELVEQHNALDGGHRVYFNIISNNQNRIFLHMWHNQLCRLRNKLRSQRFLRFSETQFHRKPASCMKIWVCVLLMTVSSSGQS
jgi:hypothetical protein